MTHDEYVKTLMSHLKSAVTKQVMIALIKKAPWVGMKFVNPLIGFLVGLVVEKAIYETEMAVFLTYTDIRVTAQGRAFSEAAVANQKIQASGTPEQKAAAEKALVDSFREFVKLKN